MAINKSQLAVPDYLLDIAQQILDENLKPERARCQTAVTLRRRFRGATKSDLLGRFGYSDAVAGVWVGDGPEQELLMNMYGFHVVKPIIRANQSSMAQAEVECTIKSTSKNPNVAGVASIARGIYKVFNNDPDYWSNNLKNQIAQQSQTDPGYFIRNYHDPDAESPIDITLDEYSDGPIEQAGEYACQHCASTGPILSAQMGRAREDGTIPCLNDDCDKFAEVLQAPTIAQAPIEKTTSTHPAGNTVLEVVSAFQMRVDERKTKNGQLRKAQWLEHHFLSYEDELQAQAPYFDFGSPLEWSEPLKWEYSLESGTDLYLKPWQPTTGRRRVQHEVRRIYLRPARYRHYRAPQDFTLDRGDGEAAVNRDGTPTLAIKAGERLIDKFPKGFWFTVCNGQLAPMMQPADLRDEWAYGGFLNDSASFWYQPASELNELQRAANNLYTIEMQHLETSSIVTTFFDREWFNAEDFERNLSPTKQGTHIATGDDISRHFKTVVPPQLSGVMQGMEFIRSLIPDVTGLQPAAVGAPSPGEPYAAQRLQRQQSLGLLTPAQQSMAAVKAISVMQHLKIAQKTKPVEWFQYIGTMYGEEWKDQDIQAFLDSNLELDLIVSYKEGTEIPTTVVEQEMKYRQFLLDVGQVVELTGNADLLKPQMLSQYAEISGLDYDFENVEADERLADSRYQKIKSWLAHNQDSGMPESALVEIALADRALEPTADEGHETHIEFYQDHITALMAVDDPNYALVESCKTMISRHREGIKKQMQAKSEIGVEGHAPEIAAQVAAQQAAAQAEAEAEKQRQDQEAAARNQEDEAATRRQAMAIEAKREEGDKKRAHDAEQKAEDRELKAFEIANRPTKEIAAPEVAEHPMDTIAKSADYSELPVPAQEDVLEYIGLPTSGVRDVNAGAITRAQIASAKTRASQSSSGASR